MNIIKVLLGVSLAFMYYMNYLGSATNKLGVKISELGIIFPFQFMPPGWTFMISWATIFIGLLVWFIIEVCKKNSIKKRELKIFFISMLLNIAWLILTGFGYYVFSVFIILALGISIASMLFEEKKKQTLHSLTSIVWGIYFGWILIATTIIGFSQIMYVYNPTFALSHTWMYIILSFGISAVLIGYKILGNKYALLWSLLAILSSILAIVGA